SGSLSGSILTGVAATSPSNVWAVGHYDSASTPTKPLIEHYNGTRWSVVASPNVSTSDSVLSGVVATSPSTVWAVGPYFPKTGPTKTLIKHYDGTRWGVV